MSQKESPKSKSFKSKDFAFIIWKFINFNKNEFVNLVNKAWEKFFVVKIFWRLSKSYAYETQIQNKSNYDIKMYNYEKLGKFLTDTKGKFIIVCIRKDLLDTAEPPDINKSFCANNDELTSAAITNEIFLTLS